MTMRVTGKIRIPERELHLDFIKSSGPGGQKINKTSSAVQLRFDAASSPSLPADVKKRLLTLAGSRATSRGEIIIRAGRHRSQKKNRNDARHRLCDLIRQAALRPQKRKRTKPPAAAREKRLERKKRRGRKKELRRSIRPPAE